MVANTTSVVANNHYTVNTSISSSNVYMGAILWEVIQNKPMVYEQEDVVGALLLQEML